MGHKVLLPVDGDVVNIKIFAFPEDYKAAFLSISAGKAPGPMRRRIVFRFTAQMQS
ncbi:hypothetical protein JS565_04760 [Salmonella enterica subsp. enterica serovar Senftenberg]|nr:hypothetical protein [Salmonella enterica subsp. enterica serovar Senftenberg]